MFKDNLRIATGTSRLSIFLLLLTLLFVPQASQAQIANRSGVDSTIFTSHTVFVPKHSYNSGTENWGIDCGDINKDGFVDIVSSSNLDGNINVHLNDGKGNFGRRRSYPAGNYNRAITMGDFNKDGWPDVACVSVKDMKVHWWLNDGTGVLVQKKSMDAGGGFPHDIINADVNGDGNIDLLTVTNSSNKLNLHFGDGTGNFAGAKAMPTGVKPRCIIVEDINKDGIIDILVGTDDREVNYWLGEGGGNYGARQYLLADGASWGIGAGDFDKNGHIDVCATSYSTNTITVWLNQGGMKFGKPQHVPSGDKNFDLVVADFDLDGDIDIVTASTRDEVINVHLNDGKGVFAPKAKISSGNWNSAICYADFDGDKDLDVATASIKDNNINIHRNGSINPEGALTATCVFGKMYDKDTGEPLSGIVAIMGEDGLSIKSAKVGPDGKYKFCDVPFGTGYTLAAKSRGYPKYRDPFDLPESVGKDGLRKDAVLEKIKETKLFGRVVDIETKAPLPNSVVEIKDKAGKLVTTLNTDFDGKYNTVLPFGTNYQIKVTQEGYLDKTGVVSLYPNDYPAGVERNFELQKIKPKTTACIKGHVIEMESKAKIPGATVKVLDAEGNIITEVLSNEEGYYEACDVPFGTYNLSGNKKGYMYNFVEGVVVTPEDVDEGVTQDIELLKFVVGAKIVLKNIYYDVAKATLRDESVAELDRLITIMEQNPTLVVEIGGHTDSDGSESYNQRLSQARAQSVVDYLLDASVPEDRLAAKGYGEVEPIAPNDTKENKQLNRRTEFKVLAF